MLTCTLCQGNEPNGTNIALCFPEWLRESRLEDIESLNHERTTSSMLRSRVGGRRGVLASAHSLDASRRAAACMTSIQTPGERLLTSQVGQQCCRAAGCVRCSCIARVTVECSGNAPCGTDGRTCAVRWASNEASSAAAVPSSFGGTAALMQAMAIRIRIRLKFTRW